MKNINKSNIMGLIGMDVINIKNEVVGTVVGDFNGKYIINVDGEEKFYSESTLIRNWKIVEDETEEVMNENDETEDAMNENDELIEEETEEVIDEENTENENKADEDEIVEETEEEVINENDEVIEEETEEEIINENDEVIEEETEEEIINENDEDEIVEETEEVINEENIEDENKSNEVIEEETEEFVLETENEGIIDNIKETEGKVKITGHLYGVPVKFDKINQTTVWKTLIKLYDNRKDENDKYSLEDKKYLVRQLKQLDEKVFAGAFRCLVSKTKQKYIGELMK